MTPRMSVIGAAIRTAFGAGDIGKYPDYLWGDVVLAMTMNSRVDKYWSKVSALIDMDTGVIDYKGKTVSLVGSAAQSAVQSKFGGYSCLFNGTTSYLDIAAHADFGLLTKDYTLECWIKTSAVGTIFDFRNSALDYGVFYIASGGFLAYDHTYGTITGNISVIDDLWHHVAFVRLKGVLTIYVDGLVAVTGIANENLGSTRPLRIGANVSSGSFFNGYMDDIRVSKGLARYIGEFSAPKISHPNGTAQTFIDETGKSVTAINVVTSPTFKFGNGSAYFDGAGAYLTAGVPADWTFLHNETTPFTIEGWVYYSGGASNGAILSTSAEGASPGLFFGIFGSSGNKLDLQMYRGDAPSYLHWQSSVGITANVWTYVACVYDPVGRLASFYINGVASGSGVAFDIGGTWPSPSSANPNWTAQIGRYPNASTPGFYFNGYIDDLRITKNSRYIAPFTPPTREFSTYSAPTYDPYWNSVVLGMHMDGVDSGVVFTDVKGKTITAVGNAQTKTAIKKFGTASAYFDGSGDYLTTPSHSDFAFGTGDFTVELWYKPNVVNTYQSLFQTGRYETNQFSMQISNTGKLQTFFNGSSTAYGLKTGLTSLVAGEWHHISASRNSGILTTYLNGVQQTSGASSESVASSVNAVIGAQDVGGTYSFTASGYIDDLRVTKGIGRYAANFEPQQFAFSEILTPVRTLLDPYYDNVVLNMHFNGPNASTSFIDEKGKTCIVYGNSQLSNAQSKFGGVSGYFDGSGDYLTIANSSDFTFGSGDATIELLFRCAVNTTTQQCLISKYADSATGWTIQVNAGAVIVTLSGDGIDITSDPISPSVWHHLALVKLGSELKLYINGRQSGPSYSGAIALDSAALLRIGANVGTAYMNGYIDDLRITKGVARYLSNFTPNSLPNPDHKTAPLATDPYWKDVVLHMPMDGVNGQTTFTESTGKSNTPSGNVQISTSQSKFGGSSAYFDGAGDYLTFLPSSSYDFSATDFTIECFIRPTSVSSIMSILVCRSSSTGNGWMLLVYPSGALIFQGSTGSPTYVSSANSLIVASTWQHIAACKNGSTISIFVNGILAGSGAVGVGPNSAEPLYVGRHHVGGYEYNGYMDEIRITKGMARYTANFNPPLKPFALA